MTLSKQDEDTGRGLGPSIATKRQGTWQAWPTWGSRVMELAKGGGGPRSRFSGVAKLSLSDQLATSSAAPPSPPTSSLPGCTHAVITAFSRHCQPLVSIQLPHQGRQLAGTDGRKARDVEIAIATRSHICTCSGAGDRSLLPAEGA